MNNLFINIKYKIGLITSITILFFGILACILTYYSVQKSVSTQIDSDFNHIIKTGAQVIEQKLFSSTDLVKNIALDPVVINFLSQNNSDRITNSEDISQYLAKFNIGQNYSAIYILDHTGVALATSDSMFLNQNYSFRPYFIEALAGKSFVDVNYGVTSQKLGYYFSYPIKNLSDEIIGVAVVKLDPSSVNQVFNSLIGPDLSDLMLVDQYGVVVASGKPQRIFRSLGKLDLVDLDKIKLEQKYSNMDIMPLQYDEAISYLKLHPRTNFNLTFKDSVDQDEEKLFLTPIQNSSFYLVSEVGYQNKSKIAQVIAIFISKMVGITAVTTLIILVISLSSQLSPISQLTNIATEISQGNYDINNPVRTNDEFNTLGNVMENMAKSLKNKYSELETIVAERTQKLEQQTTSLTRTQLAINNLLEDTTLAKQVAETAVVELQKYKKAVDNASDHIIITDPEGKIIYANAAVTKLTGFPSQEIIGKKAGSSELWGGQMPPEFYRQLWQTIKVDKKTFVGEINNKRKNGQKYIALSSISPILDSQGNVVFFVGIERDATTAREVDRMKTEFVSFASHQLRTPLSAMKWFAEMLLAGDAGKLNKAQKEYIQNIYDSNERMVELVKDLLDISRIESGRIIIDPVPTDLIKLVKGILTEVTIKANLKDQTILSTFSPKIPTVNLDPSLVRNVYLNLLNNAIKYTPEKGKITLKISVKGTSILSEVSDNGFGIPQSQQDQTFQKFFRATNAVKKETEGTGLGLYLVKSVVESSGGKIWFKSTEGRGTSFWFTIPIKGVPKKEGQVRLSVK